ncbi:bifunctional glutathionylspermidine amidase/glutathionylspermidine synthetase [Thraustotheca clavata]|uniref:Bifunctional glutathionylspermidine amidase/glutathionylspermidine synthetase n=1 Tax=Thraustotheca clavata TaxID=74557 RepID=A0A1W0A501_9STRA|nr:bifunctional glutathionylspermidine amidase/glutathionylspermidine synthetase [Thraustotheca clavata]
MVVMPAKSTMSNAPNSYKNDLALASVKISAQAASTPWLDATKPYVPVFQEQYGTHLTPNDISTYYTLTESGQAGIEYATNELHALFLQATEYVLAHENEVAPYFHIPKALWPKIQKSFRSSKNDTISGRFDFALTENGIKVYEYNADSASCLFECGHTQDQWSKVVGVDKIGRSSSNTLFDQLVAAWKSKNIQGKLHFLCDNDHEERYHSLYMMSAAQAAGIECILVVGVADLHWANPRDENSFVLDRQGNPIRNVWKTWAWQTVISQYEASNGRTENVRVMDVMLHDQVRVFEPLWTVLPSSKAILPILSQLAPNNSYLLRASFDEAIVSTFVGGYVAKPVMGRTGANVSIYDSNHKLISATDGKWDQDTIVYQEIALLPKYEDDKYVQVNTWAINGHYGGTVLRIDESNIIGLSSGIHAMRVISNPKH